MFPLRLHAATQEVIPSLQLISEEQVSAVVSTGWWKAREGSKTVELLPLLSQYYVTVEPQGRTER